jgi:predicted nucleic acid-binding Zn ribbon protein
VSVPELRDLPPVEENVDRPKKLSQSFLAHVDVCARSGYLFLRHRGGPTSHEMDRGTAGHEFARRFIELLVERDENTAPSEVAKDVLQTVIDDHPELQLPAAEREVLRMIAHHFAEKLSVDPDKVVALEKMLELDINGVLVRGKVDFAAIYPEAHHALIRDWKMSFAPPTADDEDFGGSFQTKLYALLLAEGKGSDDPVAIGKDVDTFTVEEVYCRNRDLPAPRKATLTRQQLLDFKLDVEATIAKADIGFDDGKWQAVPGSHCSKCPARHECPLPAELIPVAEEDDIEVLAEHWYWLTEEARQVKKTLRAYAEEHGPIPIGADLELAFSFSQPSERVKDVAVVKGLIADRKLDEADYIEKVAPSPRFDKRKVKRGEE